MTADALEEKLLHAIIGSAHAARFDDLFLEVHAFQRAANPAYGRYCRSFPCRARGATFPRCRSDCSKNTQSARFPPTRQRARSARAARRARVTANIIFGLYGFTRRRRLAAGRSPGWADAGCWPWFGRRGGAPFFAESNGLVALRGRKSIFRAQWPRALGGTRKNSRDLSRTGRHFRHGARVSRLVRGARGPFHSTAGRQHRRRDRRLQRHASRAGEGGPLRAFSPAVRPSHRGHRERIRHDRAFLAVLQPRGRQTAFRAAVGARAGHRSRHGPRGRGRRDGRAAALRRGESVVGLRRANAGSRDPPRRQFRAHRRDPAALPRGCSRAADELLGIGH